VAFHPLQQGMLTIVIAMLVYSVSLDLRMDDFRYVARRPIAVAMGLLAQFILLPGATWGLTMLLDLPPAVEAAMILVACCPGGALSNVMTALGRGNLALSLSISAVSSLIALAVTPLAFTLLVAANPETAAWSRSIQVDPVNLLVSLLLLLAIPMSAAMLTSYRTPQFAARIRMPLRRLAGIALGIFIVVSIAAQFRLIKGKFRRGLIRWIARAINSLPVPVSPRIRTVASVGATTSTCPITRFMAALLPTISSKFCWSSTVCSSMFSRRSRGRRS